MDRPPSYAALFGSAAAGQMEPDSDIDLFLVRPDSIHPDASQWAADLEQLVRDASAWTGNDLRLLELSEAEVADGLRERKGALLDIRDHGLTIVGSGRLLRAPVLGGHEHRRLPVGGR